MGHNHGNILLQEAFSYDSPESTLPDDEVIRDLADFFKVLGEPGRVKILFVLSQKEICVQDISEALGMSQSAISHQLRILRSSKLVKVRKSGKMALYSLDDHHVETLFQQGMDHVTEGRK
ncbi:MAG: metalloregulator ArsR/SmtB family transcription factor [Spirochaetota bacterium]|nr:metalloregulator ArsR/SmtB family transcription factor [Spirochaetota bacterium]